MKKHFFWCIAVCSLIVIGALPLIGWGAITVNEVNYTGSTLKDEVGDTPDWIELYNSGPNNVNLNGWRITDSGEGGTWPADVDDTDFVLPNYTLAPGAFLVLFCEKNSTRVVWTKSPDIKAIPENDTWRYYSGTTAPSGSWKSATFNDASWNQGMVPIGKTASRGNLDCATALATLPSTAYFRHKFRLPIQSTAVTGLLVRVRASDGFAIHLNGTEIQRANLPGGSLTHSMRASSIRPTTLTEELLVAPTGLNFGLTDNVVAVEVHGANNTSDFVFDMALTALVDEDYPIIHLGFGLSDGEKVHLYNAAGTRLLKFNDKNLVVAKGHSLGQPYDGAMEEGKTLVEYAIPTPGASNTGSTAKYNVVLDHETPTFSIAPGFYNSHQTVAMSSATGGLKIYYTTDGSNPQDSTTFVYSGGTTGVGSIEPASDGQAWIRTNPLEVADKVENLDWRAPLGTVGRTVILRAIAVDDTKSPPQCSPEASGTYFIGAQHANRTLPIVSIIAERDDLFGFTAGLFVPGKSYADSPEGYGDNRWGKPYANYHQSNTDQEWERAVRFELFEPEHSQAAVSLIMGLTIHGGGSRTIPQKSLYLLSRRGEYGTDVIEYPFFPDETATTYKRFLLRNNGGDWYGPLSDGISTTFKDAVLHRIVRNLDVAIMAYRPVVTYINGEYWGIHNLRESYDKHYLATRYGLDSDNVDILEHSENDENKFKVDIKRITGDKQADEDYEDLLAWIAGHPLTDGNNYQQLQEWLDVYNHADYIIAETFFANTDWPINNCDFWRAATNQTATSGVYGDTRWRWMLYDLDLAGEEGVAFNMFSYLSSNRMTDVDEPGFLINKLWTNPNFREHFIKRYNNLLNTTFTPHHTAQVIAEAAACVAPEVETHFRRWGRNVTRAQWSQTVTNSLVNLLAARHSYTWEHLSDFFHLDGTGALTVCNADPGGVGGHFIVNDQPLLPGVDGVDTRARWSGTFFRSRGVQVVAVPDEGYRFDGWVGTGVTNPEPLIFVGATPISLTARFVPLSTAATAPTAYELWALENYTEQEVLATTKAQPQATSGIGTYSNYDLFALGMPLSAGTTPEQVAARTQLSIQQTGTQATLVHITTPAAYTLLSSTSLLNAVWLPYTAQTTTNLTLDRIQHQLPLETRRFFKWQISQPE